MTTEKKTKLKATAMNLVLALVALVGLEKLMEMLAAKGPMVEKIGAFSALAIGAGLQFTKSDIAKTIGIVSMAKGGLESVKALITKDGSVRPDPVSSTLAKAIMPSSGLAGYHRRRGMNGLGNLSLSPVSVGMPFEQPENQMLASLTDF
jgi:hypothetical protein